MFRGYGRRIQRVWSLFYETIVPTQGNYPPSPLLVMSTPPKVTSPELWIFPVPADLKTPGGFRPFYLIDNQTRPYIVIQVFHSFAIHEPWDIRESRRPSHFYQDYLCQDHESLNFLVLRFPHVLRVFYLLQI
jgi:hypothetical protein